MSESISTSSVPLRWAEERAKGHDFAQTGFFLFREEAGHVVVHESPEQEKGGLELPLPATNIPGGIVPGERSSVSALRARIPQTKLLSTRPDQRYILLKKYEGFVTARHNGSFSARLSENSSDYPVVEADFDLEELSETDRELVVEGAPLVWTIGYRYEGNTRKRESVIYLRRLPPWSAKEIEQGKTAAEELTRAIRWE